jgi:hypothetical protein
MEAIVNLFNNKVWTFFDGLVTIGTLCMVLLNIWLRGRQKKIELQKIKIYFKNIDTNEVYLLDLDIARKDITRSEIQGILNAFQNDPSQRYSINYLSKIQYLDDIYKIQNNQQNELYIELTNEEFNGKKDEKEKNKHDGFNKNKMELIKS